MGWIPKLKIAHKLPLLIVAAALVVSAGVGVASYLIAEKTVEQLTQDRLEFAATERAEEFVRYLQQVSEDLSLRASTAGDSIHEFVGGWKSIKEGTPSEILRKAYIEDNPNPAGEKIKLDRAVGSLSYNFVHGGMHPAFRSVIEKRGYRDLLLFDNDGNVVYSVSKDDDFGQNFLLLRKAGQLRVTAGRPFFMIIGVAHTSRAPSAKSLCITGP